MGSMRQYLHDLVIRKKILILLLLLTLTLSTVISVTLYSVARSNLDRALARTLEHSARTAALLIDGDALDRIRSKADEGGPEWTEVMRNVTRVREENNLGSVYVLRRSATPGRAEFIADSSRGRTAALGEAYDLSRVPAMERAFQVVSVDADIVSDEYGASLSGYAPIRREDGTTAAIIGLDMDASDVLASRSEFKRIAGGIALLFLFAASIASFAFARILTRPIVEMSKGINALSAGRLETRMIVRGRDEIGQLSSATNRMLDTLCHYLPTKLVGQILASASDLKLGGSAVQVTSYFSDIAGFTSISERLTPEQTVALLNEYLSTMTDIIEDLGGTVDKYVGDAVVAFWGAPLAVADHAAAACEAALRQDEAVGKLRERWRSEGKPEIYFRVGLNTGEVVAGNMGSSRRFNYTVIGDSVNLASRLEGVNKLYGTRILLGEETYELIKGAFECRRLDRVRVVGRERTIAVYELIGRTGQVPAAALAARDRFESALDRFRAGDWEEAETAFRSLRQELPADKAVGLYLYRIDELRAGSTGVGWDGTYDLTAK